MSRAVKSGPPRDLQATRISRTEAAIVAAAGELFLSQGYVATTLAQVADRAGVATRTVFVRFGSKAALFRRVVDRALVGDDKPIAMAQRPGTILAMTAPTLDERIEALVDVAAGVWDRVGALFVVAAQAEGIEPEIAEAWQAGRRETARIAATFWRRAAADGLLAERAPVTQLGVSTDLLVCADTIVHLRRTRDWTVRDYRRWLTANLRLLAGPGHGASRARS